MVTRFKVRGSRFEAWRQMAPARIPRASEAVESGFTLLELMIVMVIIGILATIAVPAFVANVKAAKEAVLREDLQIMRQAIGSYTVDKQKAPQALDDLVQSGYLKGVPKDPITGQSDWITAQSNTLATIDQTDSGGIDDVHSAAQGIGLDGTSYSTW